MSLASTIRAGRTMVERQMLDTVRIRRPTGKTTHPTTGVVTVTYATPAVYTGKGKIGTYEAFEGLPEAGGHVSTVQRYRLSVPVGSCAPQVGDVADVTAAPLDASLVGRLFRVTGLHHETAATAMRLPLEEVTA
ncbi:MAG: DUF6093 family protein [Sphaerochaeta sp.]|jgi:hypothetical protein|nr:DUF6093 family protein [Sphaerochaeta sp.]